MIRITVELVPFGIEQIKKPLATMKIWNDATGDKKTGNYGFRISKCGAVGQTWKEGEIKGFPRLRKNAWHLLFLVLKSVIDEKEDDECI